MAEQGDERDEGRDGKKKKNRCLSCKKKVGLTGELQKRTCNIKLIEKGGKAAVTAVTTSGVCRVGVFLIGFTSWVCCGL